MDFKGQVVVVTGAGRGIGRGIALMYAAQGARVIIADRDPEAGLETEGLVRSAGGGAFFQPTDVARPGDIVALMEQAAERYSGLDILINNAGVMAWKSPYEVTLEEWDEVINTNLRGTFLCAREAAKLMKQRGGGAIVNISSTRALMSEARTEAYSASKGGILALTHALALSLGPDGIMVNAISPGWIETGDYEGLRGIDHSQHPSGRVGRVEDIARACLFLTSRENGFITGINVVVDGGMTRKMIYEP